MELEKFDVAVVTLSYPTNASPGTPKLVTGYKLALINSQKWPLESTEKLFKSLSSMCLLVRKEDEGFGLYQQVFECKPFSPEDIPLLKKEIVSLVKGLNLSVRFVE